MNTTVIITSKNGKDFDFEVEAEYNPPTTGGSYEGRDFERLGDDFSVRSVKLNGVDVTARLERFCKWVLPRIDEEINQ